MFLRDLIALIISSQVGGFVLISKSSDASVISGGFSGSGLFRILEKCSATFGFQFGSEVPRFPCLINGDSVIVLISTDRCVILYTVRSSFFEAATSGCCFCQLLHKLPFIFSNTFLDFLIQLSIFYALSLSLALRSGLIYLGL